MATALAPLATDCGPTATESAPVACESSFVELVWKYLMPLPLMLLMTSPTLVTWLIEPSALFTV